MKTVQKIILYGKTIEYELERKKVKNINLRVRSDGTVYVSASPRVSIGAIEKFLSIKGKYILSAMENCVAAKNNSTECADGNTVYVLGIPHKVAVSQGKKNGVTAQDGIISVTVKDTDCELIKKTYKKWRDEKCKAVIDEICKNFYIKFPYSAPQFPKLRFREMSSRWGSCNFRNSIITFNLNLFEAPVGCIEFIVAHEFSHFSVPNHSADFYRQLEEYMPDWKNRKNILNKKSYIK